MKNKIIFLAIFAVFVLAFSIGSYLYAQEAGEDRDDSPQEGSGVSLIPDDNELTSLLTTAPNPNAVVRPLIQTKWHQGFPFNSMYPNRVVAGCGPVAIAQLLNYHQHPALGRGVKQGPFRTSRLGELASLNYNVTLDWANMLNSYRRDGRDSNERQQNAVGTLFYYVAASYPYYQELVNHFGYDRSIQRPQRMFYTDTEWVAMIRQQLDAGLPVYYWGNHPGSDHAFIVDGYDSTGRFHINWGWGGRHDGWYSLDNLNPRGNREWYNNQRIMINVKPDAGGKGAGWEMALLNFTVNKTSISQNEQFTVSAQVRNISVLDRFAGGRWGAALVDNRDNIVAIIGDRSASARNPQTSTNSTPFEINCFVPNTVPAGQYRLRIAVRPTDGEWRIIKRSAIGNNIPNVININVTAETGTPGGGYGMGLTAFTASRTAVSRNESFTVTYTLRNFGQEVFPGGQASAVLVDNNGNIAAILGTRTPGSRQPGGTAASATMDCTVPGNVAPGRYQLRMAIRPGNNNNNNQWRIATLSSPGIPTSIDFTVR